MKKQILLPPAVLRELRTTFRVHQVVLNRALKYQTNSSRDRLLRTAALRRGGLVYLGMTAPKGYLPEVETSFEGEYMRQMFGTRIEVLLHLERNSAVLKIDGREAAVFRDLTAGDWSNMLYSLQQIYNRIHA